MDTETESMATDRAMEDVNVTSMESFEEIDEEPIDAEFIEHKDIEDILDEEGHSFDSNEETLLQDADGVITFKMSLQKRLNELHDAFENFGQGGLSLSNFWCLYFETYVEPIGWKALWKQRDESSSSDGSVTVFKAIETVEVAQINCANLSTRVQRDDGSILSVPLSEVYPLAQQENSFLSMKVTAKCIDNYRFFLNHLVFPWDSENADRWCELHLESRIQFYYDIQSGVISETTASEIKDLIREAKLNQTKIDSLEDKLGLADSEDDIVDENLISEMLPIHMRQEEIKSRLQMLENPLWRNMLNKHKVMKNRSTSRIQESVILVVDNFTTEVLKADLSFIGTKTQPDQRIKVVSNLQEALERCQQNATIFIKAGVHKISGLGNIEEGGSIIGIPDGEGVEITLEPKDAGDVWLVANSEKSVSLENVVVRVTSKWSPPTSTDEEESVSIQQAACSISLLVLRGTLNLQNVLIQGFVGDNGIGCEEQETIGVKALEQGSVHANQFEVKNFATACVVREQANIVLKSSKIRNSLVGIETNPGGIFELNNVEILKCQKFGILVYTTTEMQAQVGAMELLGTDYYKENGFCMTDVLFQDCSAGNVCICNETVILTKEETI